MLERGRPGVPVTFFLIILLFTLTRCVVFAPPSPMVTYGGPKTTDKGTSETAIALGTGIARFDAGHSGGQGWFGRYKYGLSDKWDLGIDAIGFSHSDKFAITSKIAARYQLLPNFRLEGGAGAADDSQGKSLNGDMGLTWGTLHEDKVWNFYSTLRFGYAKGYAGNAAFTGGSEVAQSDSIAPPSTSIALLNAGAQGKISDNMKFIFEGGYGYLFPQGQKSGAVIYLSCGLLFKIGEKKK